MLYIIRLNRSSDISRPQISYYTQGISAQCIHLENVKHWSIKKIIIINGIPISFSLNRQLIAAQRLMKAYCKFLRSLRSLRVLFKREATGVFPKWTPPPIGVLYC